MFVRKAWGVVLLGVALPAWPQSPPPGSSWPADEFRAAVLGCRSSMHDNAKRDYLRSRNLTESQLPPNFRSGIEPLLRTCDCMIGVLAREVSIQTFAARGPGVQRRMQELGAPGGVCELKRGS